MQHKSWLSQLNAFGFSLLFKGISCEFKISCFRLNSPLFLFPKGRFSCSLLFCGALSSTCMLILCCWEVILIKTGPRSTPSVLFNMSALFSNFHYPPCFPDYEHCWMWLWLFLSFLSCSELLHSPQARPNLSFCGRGGRAAVNFHSHTCSSQCEIVQICFREGELVL